MQENILNKIYDLWKILLPVAGKLPRQYKFVLGERIQNIASELMERSVEAYFTASGTAEKRTQLLHANLKVELLRRYLRLSHDLGLVSLSTLERLQRQVDEIGRMLGGWLKSLK
jgi:hypothetical protein